MRVSLTLLPHDDDAVGRTGNGATDVDQIAIRIDLLDAEVSLRVTRRAVVARHLLALDDARRIRAGSDRARTTVLRVAVRVRTAADAVALHDALESATFRRSRHLHRVADGEHVDLDDVADRIRRDLDLCVPRLIEPDRAHDARR